MGNLIVDAIFNNIQLLISIFGAISLGIGLQIFRGSLDEEPRKNARLGLLEDRQMDRILNLIENEIGLYQRANTPHRVAQLDPTRRRTAKRMVDNLWEDALVARKLEVAWNNWRRWERLGHDTCSFGIFLNLGLLLLILFGLPNYFQNQLFWIISTGLVFSGPLIIAFLCWIILRVKRNRALAILDTPILGAPGRRFGDA